MAAPVSHGFRCLLTVCALYLAGCATTPEPDFNSDAGADVEVPGAPLDMPPSLPKAAVDISPSPENFAALLYVTRQAMFVDAVSKECAESAMIADVTMQRWRYRNAHLLDVTQRYHQYMERYLAANDPATLVKYKKEHVVGALDLLSQAKRAYAGDQASACLSMLKQINLGAHDFDDTNHIMRLNRIDQALRARRSAASEPTSQPTKGTP